MLFQLVSRHHRDSVEAKKRDLNCLAFTHNLQFLNSRIECCVCTPLQISLSIGQEKRSSSTMISLVAAGA